MRSVLPAGERSAALTRRDVLALAGAALLAPLAVRATVSVPSRGINIPNWFDRPDGAAPNDAVLAKLRRCGFETIRLPIDGDVALSAARPAIRSAIERLVAMGFSVLADLHPSAGLHAVLRADVLAAGAHVSKAWTALAAVIADLPADKVYAELLNEPPMGAADWHSLRDRLAGIVRAACPHHTIVWGPASDQGIWQLDAAPPLVDGRQIAAVHFYAPMAFTHQCQSWGDSPLARIKRLPFPATRTMPQVEETIAALRASGDEAAARLVEQQLASDWSEAAIGAEIARAADWAARTGCPVMMNEFGVLAFCAGPADRVAWVRAVRRAAEKAGIGWAYWELDQGFGLIADRSSTEGFDGAMLDALFGTGG